MRVLLVGPDGAGKSTLADAATEAMSASGLRVRRLHFDLRPATAPATAPVTTPHVQPPRGAPGQLASVGARGLRYMRASWPGGALHRAGADLILQERGWLDQSIDPARYRMTALGAAAARVLAPLAPGADRGIRAEGDPDQIVARKPELSSDEVDRQIAAWRRLTGERRWRAVDTVAQTPSAATDALLNGLREARAARALSALTPVLGTPRRLEMISTAGGGVARRSLYRPYSAIGRIRRATALRSPIAARRSDLARRVATIVGALDVSWDALAAIRSHGRSQGVVAVLRDGHVAEYIRLRWDASESVEAEADVLRALTDLDSVRVPTVVGTERIGDMSVLRMTAIDGSGSAPVADVSVALDVAVTLRWARRGRGVTHGDFTAWNLLSGAVPGLIDWERSSLEFEPGADLNRYFDMAPPGLDPQLREATLLEYADRCAR